MHITKAIASADPTTTPYLLIAARVSQVISAALQRAVAFNALDFRFSKPGKGRAVGGGAVPVGGAAAAQQLLGQAVNDWDADDDELPAEGGD